VRSLSFTGLPCLRRERLHPVYWLLIRM
jgi:hypothetical protein